MTDKALRAILSANAVRAIDLNFSETNVSELYGAMILARATPTKNERIECPHDAFELERCSTQSTSSEYFVIHLISSEPETSACGELLVK